MAVGLSVSSDEVPSLIRMLMVLIGLHLISFVLT